MLVLSSLLRVRPTKIELIRLRRRLALARKVHRILRERLTILVNEFLTRAREAYRLRLRVNELITRIYSRASMITSIYGSSVFDYYKSVTRKPTTAVVGIENIMGVKTRTAIVKEAEIIEPLYPGLDTFRREAFELIQLIIDLGRAEQALLALGREIEKTKRKVNALQYLVIPRMENTIRYLMMKFEEREREEKARLKRVKSVLERRRGG
ncbi:MAG: V-type ATP synthase subunit D [Thermoprotei archaeon]